MAGTDRVAGRSTIRPATVRGSRWRSRRTRSRSGRTGTVTAGPARRPGTTRWLAASPAAPARSRGPPRTTVRPDDRSGQVGAHVVPRDLPGGAGHPDEVPPRRNLRLERPERRPEAPTHPISLDGGAGLAGEGKSDPNPLRLGGDDRGNPEAPLTAAAPLPTQPGKLLTTGDRPDQADRRWRPLARRDFRTARPALVDIRARNPCFLDRRRLFG